MKFGYSCNITNWNRKPHTEVADEVRDIAVHCDEAGGTGYGSPSTWAGCQIAC